MHLVGATGWRPYSFPLPSLSILLLPDLLKGLLDVAGPSLPDQPSDNSPKERIFQPGPASVSFPNTWCIFLAEPSEKRETRGHPQRAYWRRGQCQRKMG